MGIERTNMMSNTTPSFQAKMRNRDIRAMKKFYARELKNTTDPDRMDRITKGCQNFSRFLDKISEGDSRFIVKHTESYNNNYLVLKHSKDSNFSSVIRASFMYENPIKYYNDFFSEKTANDILEMEKVLSNNYEKKQKSTSFLSNLLKKL